jgi:serine/threonine protein kinase/Tol biopolymer transport system component
MPNSSWPRVKQVIESALEQPAAERSAFVRQACGDDRALCAEVESLLAAMDQAGSFAERPAIQSLSVTDLGVSSAYSSPADAAVEPGTSIGPYTIVELVGAGGMGQVYRARDAKLNRDVALKILPVAFAADPDRLARFRREAQVLASLNHPNIGHIFGLEDGTAPPALVLEFVEGSTLDGILRAQGPGPLALGLADALPIARQIAEALEAAHEQGVVHRDLKPANVKVRPDGLVKVLDFGLARALDQDASRATAAEAVESPTMTGRHGMTDSGMILGTAPYMSPEQARGKVVDKRADIWAFGCVLFEMLTGRRPFDGETSSDTIAAILGREPDWAALPAATPASLRGLLQRCLEKDAKRRLRDIGDARIEIERLISESGKGAVSAPRGRSVTRWAVLAAALVLLPGGIYAVWSVSRSRPLGPLRYTQITDFSNSATAASLSPDGRMVTFIRGGTYFQSRGQIYVKLLPNGEPKQLTDDPRIKFAPVFTPDGSRIAFSMIDGSWDTWTVPVLGGEPPSRLLPNASGLTWLDDTRVLYSEMKTGRHMGIVTSTNVRADSREIYLPEHQRAMAHYSYASSDRKWVLIVEMGPGGAFTQPCLLVPFDGRSAARVIGPSGACRSAAWSPDGRWMYFGALVNGHSHLWRQAFPNGAPEQITFDPTEEEGVTVAPDGNSLVTSVGEERTAIWIHDGAGDRQITSEGSARLPQVSADGRRVFYQRRTELMQVELASGRSVSLLPGVPVTGFGYDVSADGSEVAFASRVGNRSAIWLAFVDRRSPPREVTHFGDQVSFGANGALVFRQSEGNANYVYRINRDGSGRERLTSAPILSKGPVSPDGEWVIVNRASPGEEPRAGAGGDRIETVAVPTRGGAPRRVCAFDCLPGARWSADGTQLYFSDGQTSTAILPVPRGQSFPELPASGLNAPADMIAFPGARAINQTALIASVSDSTYVFLKTEARRNLFRIDLR